MRTKIVLLVLSVMLFNSCIVKSLQPFYSKDKLAFEERLIGKWQDQRNGIWEITSFKDGWEEEQKDQNKISKEDSLAYENYKQGYIIRYEKNEKEALFIGMPFLVDSELFLDLTPFQYESEELNSLVVQHLLKTHSAAKVDFNNNNPTISFLSEERIRPLFNEQKIKLKHEKTGVDGDLILTASSQELHAFLKKFKNSSIENKWTKDQYKLKPDNATP